MVILIAGASHTGKTILAQRILEKYKYSYLSIDHLKMGLIRSKYCYLNPESSNEELTSYLWPIVREIIKTNIENNQNLVIEGCYIPFNYKDDFEENYLECIKYICLIFSEEYIKRKFHDIKSYSNIIEKRLDDGYCTQELLIRDNLLNLDLCKKNKCDYTLIDGKYEVNIDV